MARGPPEVMQDGKRAAKSYITAGYVADFGGSCFACHRYLIVLRYGGVYADVDTECGRPLDDFILASDSLVVGWEDEYATPELAVQFRFARQRQLEQWVFAAEPGHPALQVRLHEAGPLTLITVLLESLPYICHAAKASSLVKGAVS